MLPAFVIGLLALLPSSFLTQLVSVAFGAPDSAVYRDETLAAPPESLALVADANNPLWRTRYGTELGRQLLPARAPDFPQVPEAYEPPLVGTWLTRTIQSGSVWTRAIVGVPDGRVFAAINGDGLRVFTPSVATGAYFWSAIHTSVGGLGSDNVTSLALVNGDLWVGTSDMGISVLDLQSGNWSQYRVNNSPLPNNYISRITYIDPPHGTRYAWVSTAGGATRIVFTRLAWTWTTLDTGDGLPSSSILDVDVRYIPFFTMTYIATANGLMRWDGTSMLAVNGSASGGSNCTFQRAERVHIDRFNQIWVLPQDDIPGLAAQTPDSPGSPAYWTTDGVCRFSGSTWTRFNAISPGLPTGNVSDFAEDGAGRIWLAINDYGNAPGGAAVYDKDTWKIFTKANSPIYTTTVATVQSVGEDVWWGFFTSGNASIYSPNWLRFTAASLNGSGIPNTIYLDAARTFVGLGNNFVWRASNAWNAETLPGNAAAVNSFANAGSQQWWVGTGGNGIYLYDDSGANPLYTHYTTAQGLPDNSVTSLLTDQQSRLWVGTVNGLALRAQGGYFLTFTVSNSGLLSNIINALAQDGMGRLWIGTPSGVSIYDLNANGGNAWSSYSTAQGLPGNFISGLARDPAGGMWASTTGGVGQWNPASATWISHTLATGALPGNAANNIASDPVGRIWVGTRNGVALFASGQWTKFHEPGSTLASDAITDLASDGKRGWMAASGEVAVRGVLTAPIGNHVPLLSSFNPTQGSPGDHVTISGNYFDDAGADLNIVRFCGDSGCANSDPEAEVLSATVTSLSVKVPPLAGSGKLQVKANGLQSLPSAADFQLVPKITGLSDSCVTIGDELKITGSGLMDGSAGSYVTIGSGTERIADASDPTMIRTFIRAGDTSGTVKVRLLNGQSATSSQSVTFGSVSVNAAFVQQGIQGQALVWGKRTLVQLQLKSTGCSAQVDEATLDWVKLNSTTAPGGRWSPDAPLTVKTTPDPVSIETAVSIIAEFDSNRSQWTSFFPLSQFNGVNVTVKHNHIPVINNFNIPKTTFNYIDTTGVQRYLRYMRVASPNSGDNDPNFWSTAVENMEQVARAYPQYDIWATGNHPLSWQSWTPIWIAMSSVNFTVGGNYADARDAVEDYLEPDGQTWAVALVDPNIRVSSNNWVGRGGGGARTVVTTNSDGKGGLFILHEVLHAFGFVDSGATNYLANQPTGQDHHSIYNEGKWGSDISNCLTSLTYRQALIDETGSKKRVVHLDSADPLDVKLGPCGDISSTKSIMSYAPNQNNMNFFLEPVDYGTAIAQLCTSFGGGFHLVSNCAGYSVPSDYFPFLAPSAAQTRAPLKAPNAMRTLRLSGKIDLADVVTTSVFYVADNDGALTPQAITGTYHLLVRAADNSVLHDQRFNLALQELDPHGSGPALPSHANAPFDYFHLRVPFPLNATKAELRHNNTLIWQRSVSAHAPTGAFMTPNGGTYNAANAINVSWTANDTDGDPLQFGLDYSPDNGVTWINLSPKLLGTSFSWTPNYVPPGALARLRLRASDGFNSTTVTSNPFTLNAIAPQALIISPHTGASVPEHSEVTLEGSSLTANGFGYGAFTWKQDGALIGLTRTVTTTINTIGMHTITLQVAANGLTNTKALTLMVSADYDGDGMPNDWEQQYQLNPLDPADALNDPDGDALTNIAEYHNGTNPRVADGDGDGTSDGAEVNAGYDPNNGANEPPTTPVLNIGTVSVGFTALQGFTTPGAKSTWISNGGGGALNWTAGDDAAWLSISPASGGNGPTQLQISVNQAGLPVGTYTGHVTVTASGAAQSPHVIEVHLNVQPFAGNLMYLPIVER